MMHPVDRLVFWLCLAGLVGLGVFAGWYFGRHPLFHCVPNAHPSICLAQCAKVQPSCR